MPPAAMIAPPELRHDDHRPNALERWPLVMI